LVSNSTQLVTFPAPAVMSAGFSVLNCNRVPSCRCQYVLLHMHVWQATVSVTCLLRYGAKVTTSLVQFRA
jgi:hypothetical protein